MTSDLLAVDVMTIFCEMIGLQMLPVHFLTAWQFVFTTIHKASLLFSKINGLPTFAFPPSNIISLLSAITPECSISTVNEHTAERAQKCHIFHQ